MEVVLYHALVKYIQIFYQRIQRYVILIDGISSFISKLYSKPQCRLPEQLLGAARCLKSCVYVHFRPHAAPLP